MSTAVHDYIVVGSGAGGGPLAANLARAGFKVLVLEAGGDPSTEDLERKRGEYLYKVPIFHGLSTEYPKCSWDFFVRHYTDDALQERDTKVVKDEDLPPDLKGQKRVWYPRAAALGGCTAHNAMITVVPQDSDWDNIAALTGDSTWRAESMRLYWARLERCKYVPRPNGFSSALSKAFSALQSGGPKSDPAHGHGFDGWLPTSGTDPALLPRLLRDKQLAGLLISTVKTALREHLGNPLLKLATRLDPNDTRNASAQGLVFTPLTVDNGRRVGPREYLLSVEEELKKKTAEFQKNPQGQPPGSLTIKKNALAARVLFEGKRAVGVEYIDRAHVYRADPAAAASTPDPSALPRLKVFARREIVLAGGAFNTPQLLMLSGIGPREQLQKFGIPVLVESEGVGANLQDRYEVGVVSRFEADFALTKNGKFAPPDDDTPDELLAEWEKGGPSVYASNGALIGIIKKSDKWLKDPDLFIFGLPANFRGYKKGYSKELERHRNLFTWAILKARTENTGRVELASPNPWDPPRVNFQNFRDGLGTGDRDMNALLDGVKFVRRMNARLNEDKVKNTEIWPGPNVDDDDALHQFIRDETWGHHASCTCKMGRDEMAVLDSRFRVRGVEGLRVVDASVFPKIPGYFIVTAIYMISEKAFDLIREDAG
ncbi:MAG TPA: GMC family oxidoreductase [Pyrinomonadaceae bacterium]|jgi:choline dehydrogenase